MTIAAVKVLVTLPIRDSFAGSQSAFFAKFECPVAETQSSRESR
jgi:hypothetical protein